MDKIDLKILKCLHDNARLTASAISEEIKLSVSAVIERIKKLESNGIIKGYTIDIDQEKMGNNMVALMEVSLKHPDYYDEFVKLVKEGNIGSVLLTPELKKALKIAGISWVTFNIVITYALESWLAELQLKAGRLGVMKSLEDLSDPRYYANIEKV